MTVLAKVTFLPLESFLESPSLFGSVLSCWLAGFFAAASSLSGNGQSERNKVEQSSPGDARHLDLEQTKFLSTYCVHGVSNQSVFLLFVLLARMAQSSPLVRSQPLSLFGSPFPHMVKLQGLQSVHFQSPSFIWSVAPIHTKSLVFSYKMGHVGDI